MKYGILDPKARTLTYAEAKDAHAAYRLAHLPMGKIDHGVLMRLPHRGGIGYAVYEFGFYVPAAQQSYCSITGTGRLIAGTALLYEFSEGGRTIDLSEDWRIEPMWFSGQEAVEEAIVAGIVPRPEVKLNNDVIWAWPQPVPPDLADLV